MSWFLGRDNDRKTLVPWATGLRTLKIPRQSENASGKTFFLIKKEILQKLDDYILLIRLVASPRLTHVSILEVIIKIG